jgi:hypothetical protein
MIPWSARRVLSETRPQRPSRVEAVYRSNRLSNAEEKRVQKLAERKGFHLEKAGHGKSHGRFYIMNVAEGARMRSGVAEHEYSFLLEEAEAWLSAYSK